ncbi:MAG: GFA family protein [Gammaproteobacteria bacterium]|nr:GFA family protein [Gammaproteobacteria bacterium]
MAGAETIRGGCMCGAVRYEAEKSSFRTGCCHCRMCQMRTGAPFISFVHIPHNDFRYTCGEPKHYKSSEISDTAFCENCGTTIMIQYYPEYYDAYVVLSATLDEPNAYPPERHSGLESQMHWLKLDDDLPCTEHVDDFIALWKSGVDFRDLLRPVTGNR